MEEEIWVDNDEEEAEYEQCDHCGRLLDSRDLSKCDFGYLICALCEEDFICFIA